MRNVNERLSAKVKFREPINDKQRNHLLTKLLDKIKLLEHQITAHEENNERRREEILRFAKLIKDKTVSLDKYKADYEHVKQLDFTKIPEPVVKEEPLPEVVVETKEPEPEPEPEKSLEAKVVEKLKSQGVDLKKLLEEL